MMKTIFKRVMWLARGTSMVLGLAVMLALVFGVATMALAGNGDPFKLGQSNTASKVSKLIKSGAGPALELQVDSGAPLKVNSDTKVAKLNADQLDGKDSTDLQPNAAARVTVFDAAPPSGVPSGGALPGTRLSFTSESYDTGGLHSNTTNNSRLTAPVSGVYQINAIVDWEPNKAGGDATKSRETRIMKNANQSGSGDQVGVSIGPSSSNAGLSQPVSTQVNLQAGDYVEVWVWQSSGVSLEVFGSSQFEMTWVAPG